MFNLLLQFMFDNGNYETLSRKIVLSQNSNWNKALALVVLNYSLIAKKIFMKKSQEEYPYYRYPYLGLKNKISYIVESLAI